MKIEVTALVDQTQFLWDNVNSFLYPYWLGKFTLIKYERSIYWAIFKPYIWNGYDETPTQTTVNKFLERSQTTLFISDYSQIK